MPTPPAAPPVPRWEDARRRLVQAGAGPEVIEAARRATAPARHAARVRATVAVVRQVGSLSAAIAVLCLDLRGVGGPGGLGGLGGCSLRLRALRALGTGRWRAHDGAAWRAATIEAVAELRRIGEDEPSLLPPPGQLRAWDVQAAAEALGWAWCAEHIRVLSRVAIGILATDPEGEDPDPGLVPGLVLRPAPPLADWLELEARASAELILAAREAALAAARAAVEVTTSDPAWSALIAAHSRWLSPAESAAVAITVLQDAGIDLPAPDECVRLAAQAWSWASDDLQAALGHALAAAVRG